MGITFKGGIKAPQGTKFIVSPFDKAEFPEGPAGPDTFGHNIARVATATADVDNGIHLPAGVIDGSTDGDNRWSSSSAAVPHWLRLEFPNARTIAKFAITKYWDTFNQTTLKDFNFQGSNDGTNWTTLGSYQATHNSINKEVEEFTIDSANRGAYTYYRVYATSNNWANNGYIGFWEIECYELENTNAELVANSGPNFTSTTGYTARGDANASTVTLNGNYLRWSVLANYTWMTAAATVEVGKTYEVRLKGTTASGRDPDIVFNTLETTPYGGTVYVNRLGPTAGNSIDWSYLITATSTTLGLQTLEQGSSHDTRFDIELFSIKEVS